MSNPLNYYLFVSRIETKTHSVQTLNRRHQMKFCIRKSNCAQALLFNNRDTFKATRDHKILQIIMFSFRFAILRLFHFFWLRKQWRRNGSDKFLIEFFTRVWCVGPLANIYYKFFLYSLFIMNFVYKKTCFIIMKL